MLQNVESKSGDLAYIGSNQAISELQARGLARKKKLRLDRGQWQSALTRRGVAHYQKLLGNRSESQPEQARYWLKLGYFTDAVGETGSRYWETRGFVSDGPGRDSPRWRNRRRPLKGQLSPPFGPRYAIGDRMVVYVKGHGCPAILEVASEPRWDPDYVTEQSDGVEGNRWGVVTDVRGTGTAVPLDRAPSLGDIGVTPSSVMRKGHIQLGDASYRRAVQLLGGRPTPRASHRRRARVIPIERGNVEGYEFRTPAQTRTAQRREWQLVKAYATFMESRGDEIGRNDIPTEGQRSIQSDIYNVTRDQLIEAKATANRSDIRMAIGQLADYGRTEPNARRAVLTEARPNQDLEALLKTQGIASVWMSGTDFKDNARGAFT